MGTQSGPKRARGVLRGVALLALITLTGGLLPATTIARAGVITVTTTSLSGPGCRLVDALLAANTRRPVGACASGAEATTVVLQSSGTTTLTTPADDDPLFGPTGMPVVTGQVTIQGNGATIERGAGAPPFRILRVASGGSLTLDRVTIQGGNSLFGGGIYVGGSGLLTLTHSVVRSNTASNGAGGIEARGNATTITDSSITGNSSTFGVGGLDVSGATTLVRSVVTNNTGGGIGGLAVFGPTVVANSTISGNSGSTGGMYLDSDTKNSVRLTSTTVVNNQGSGPEGAGGVHAEGSNVALRNTIVAGNRFGGSLTHPRADCGQDGMPIATNGNNLVGSGTGCPATGYGDRSVPPADVLVTLVGPLQDNGGPTQSHALLNGSLALDGGDNATCAAMPVSNLDQRGAPRPQGGSCDIGAVEGVGALATLTPTLSPTPSNTPTRTPTVTPTIAADLSLTLQAAPLQPAPGGNVVLTVAITNAGPSLAPGVAVRLLLPAGLTFVSSNGSPGYDAGTGIWTIGAVAVGATQTLQVTAQFSAAKPVTVTAQVSAAGLPDPDSTPNNNLPEDDQQSVLLTPFDADIIVNDAGSAVNPNDGRCTLIEAIIAANTDQPSGNGMGECTAGNGPDTIRLQALSPLYAFSIPHLTSVGNVGAVGLPVIRSDITILGGGATIERAAGPAVPSFRLFLVASGKLTLQDTTVRNGRATGGEFAPFGGAILAIEPLELVNSVVSDSRADCDGGGIYAQSTLTVRGGSVVRGNTAGCSGGGIFARGSPLVTITDSALQNNTALVGGGGGLVLFEPVTAATLENVTISGNLANSDGGGVWLHGQATQASITSSTISQNSTAAGGGGGLANGRFITGTSFVSGGTVQVSLSRMDSNEAPQGNGGGVLNLGAMTITSSGVQGNMAGINGGGLANAGLASTITMDQATVLENRVTAGNGGGIANGGLGPTFAGGAVTVRSSRVSGNVITTNVAHEEGGGGGIYSRGPLVEVSRSAVDANLVRYPTNPLTSMYTSGGGVYVATVLVGAEARVNDSAITNNRVLGPLAHGGGIRSGYYSTLMLERTVVEQNQAVYGGGASFGGRAQLTNSVIRANEARRAAGIFITNALPTLIEVTLDDTAVTANRATGSPGTCAGIDNFGNLTLRNGSSVSFNEALTSVSSAGAGLCNSAHTGALGPYTGNLTVTDSTIRGNRATAIGAGGLHNLVGRVTMERSTLSENVSNLIGALFNDRGVVTLRASAIHNNSSNTWESAITNRAGSTVLLENSTISGNSSTNTYGIINAGSLTLVNSTVSANRGPVGAIGNQGSVTLSNSIVAGNLTGAGNPVAVECASSNGGTIVTTGGNLLGQGTGCPSNGYRDNTVSPATMFTTVLGPLADHGGPTHTHRPLVGSPAVDAGNDGPPRPGNPFGCLTTDQRGIARPLDGDGLPGTWCDSGAYERVFPQDQPQPTLSALQPASAVAGGPDLTLSVTGASFDPSLLVSFDGRLQDTMAGTNPTQRTALVDAAELVSAVDIKTVLVSVRNLESAQSNALPFTIVSPRVQQIQSGVAAPGASNTANALPTAPGAGGVGATLTNNGATSEPAAVSVATYASNPTQGTLFAAGGFFDIQVANADPTDSLQAHYYYPNTVVGAAETALVLSFFEGSTWIPVRSSGGVEPFKATADNLDNTVSGGRFSVRLDSSSTPPLLSLTGTVFAMAEAAALPPTPTPRPTGSPTTTSSPTATPTAPPVGGRGLTLQSGPLVQLTWRDGLQETAYVVLRWSPTSSFAFLPSPDPAKGLPANAAGYTDGSSLPDATYCYVILPVGGTPPTYNDTLGISDLLCVYPRSGTGLTVGDFAVRLNESTTALLTWSPSVLPGQHELVAMRFDGSPPRRIPLGDAVTSFTDNTHGLATCYEVVSQALGAEVGRTDRLCAVPGVTSFTGGPAGVERLRSTLPGQMPFR